MKKKMQSTSGVSYPIKLEIGVTEADLSANEESITEIHELEELKIFYKLDNGKESFNSAKVGDVLTPSWADIFNLEIHNNKEKIFFEVVLRANGQEDTDKVIDTFDISASIMEQQLKITENLTDNLCTSIGRNLYLSYNIL